MEIESKRNIKKRCVIWETGRITWNWAICMHEETIIIVGWNEVRKEWKTNSLGECPRELKKNETKGFVIIIGKGVSKICKREGNW